MTDAELENADAVAMDPVNFGILRDLQRLLHNGQRALTFDEQRDFAEKMRIVLSRAVAVNLTQVHHAPESQPKEK